MSQSYLANRNATFCQPQCGCERTFLMNIFYSSNYIRKKTNVYLATFEKIPRINTTCILQNF
ncbi:hypothetical protein MFUM_940062 [Methylacidiphilum fumariolicum SolV]|uniref:Uncharacterized protein n=2 Tax=Candidatus Methylacidiphilum fumarolicum TaxID=591154 RepID=I0K118_METFB|nr:conserved protein of unknown function [Candidatus Methylacidiphilum fumarolicum]CCG93187.1 hypothetical protein MFUM_940062 [Methylacidiphilum fumariolicum SolV]